MENKNDSKISALNSAIVYADSSINKHPYIENAYIVKFKSLHNSERYRESLIFANKAKSLFNNPFWSLAIGISKNQLDDKSGAISSITSYINNKDKKLEERETAYRFRASVYEDVKQYANALADLNQALKIDSTDTFCYVNRARVFKALGNNDLACQDIRQAVSNGYVAGFDLIKEYCE